MVKRPSETETWDVRGDEGTDVRELDTQISPRETVLVIFDFFRSYLGL